jgi:tetratricopeptide (TPR) repeat protein
VLAALCFVAGPSVAAAQSASENAEARVYFEEGNRLFEKANRSRGAQREALFRRALEAYVDSLQIVRSRNALFNAAIVLGELGRNDEAFNYFGEYLGVEGLSEADREEATRRRDALRGDVAVLQVTSEPSGALVWVDRKDLAPRGETPIEIALRPGAHRVFVERDRFEPVEQRETMVRGETTVMALSLLPVAVLEPEPEVVPAPERPRLRNAAIGTAASTLATAGVALGLSLHARSLRDDYDAAAERYRLTGEADDYARAQELADQTHRYNIAADVFWGTTIALGVSAAVLYGMHRKKLKREAPEVAVSVSRHGGFASIRMPLGARQ